MGRDLTKGSPAKVILYFTLPLLFGNLFQQLYNMVDAVIVGQFVGTNALAAVGSTGTITFFLIGFLMGFSNGVTVITGQYFGAKDMKGMRNSAASAVVLSFSLALFMTVFSMVIMKTLLHLMNTPEETFADAYSYIMILCAGIVAQVGYNLLSALLRAIGNSKAPLYFLMIAAGLNVVLDLVFIIVFKMGTAGAGLATVISQGISALLCLFYIRKCVPQLHLNKEDWKISFELCKLQLRVALPMAFQFSITAIGSIIVQSCLNTLGPVSMAAFTTGNKIETIVTQAYVALGATMATYCAQNTGSGDFGRIRQGFRAATVLGSVYSIIVGAALFFGGKYLTVLFISENVPEVMAGVEIFLRCTAVCFIPLTIVNAYRNGIQGMGYGILPMFAGVAELVGRSVTALIAVQHKSFFGVCLANSSAWILASALLIALYFYIVHEHKKRMPEGK